MNSKDLIHSKVKLNQAHAHCPQVIWICSLSLRPCSCHTLSEAIRLLEVFTVCEMLQSVLRLRVWVGKSKVQLSAFMIDQSSKPHPPHHGLRSSPRPPLNVKVVGLQRGMRTGPCHYTLCDPNSREVPLLLLIIGAKLFNLHHISPSSSAIGPDLCCHL